MMVSEAAILRLWLRMTGWERLYSGKSTGPGPSAWHDPSAPNKPNFLVSGLKLRICDGQRSQSSPACVPPRAVEAGKSETRSSKPETNPKLVPDSIRDPDDANEQARLGADGAKPTQSTGRVSRQRRTRSCQTNPISRAGRTRRRLGSGCVKQTQCYNRRSRGERPPAKAWPAGGDRSVA